MVATGPEPLVATCQRSRNATNSAADTSAARKVSEAVIVQVP